MVSIWHLLDEMNSQSLCLLPGQNIQFIKNPAVRAIRLWNYTMAMARWSPRTTTGNRTRHRPSRLLPRRFLSLARIRYDGNIEIDLGRFLRVLCNLIKNAREAMPNGGILNLVTDLVENEVVIQIADTGVGMPADILSKLFEPFVTYGKSHGTGLGMAIATSVMDAHQGTITVSSVQGSGTTVELRLPAPGENA